MQPEAPPPGASGAREFPHRDEITSAIDSACSRVGVPGLGVAIYHSDASYAGGFGVTDVETEAGVTPDTAFYIASSTKSMTAMALAILHQRGEIDLDAPLSRLAPAGTFPEAVRPDAVRLRNLLTHTSGLDNLAITLRLAFTGQHDPQTLWRLLGACTPNTDAPLGRYQYTNLGYNIATMLTDRVLDVRWQDVLQREVFRPAGMTRTSARVSDAQRWSVAKPHWSALSSGAQRIYLEKTDETMHSAGGVLMSAGDALRWLELLVENGMGGGRQVIPAAVMESTRAPLVEAADTEYGAHHYGLGWFLSSYRDEPLVHHFGDYQGYRAHISYMPDRRIGVAVFANDASASYWLVHGVANYAYDLALGHSDAQSRFEAAVVSAIRERDERAQRVDAERAERAGLAWTLTRPQSAYLGVYDNPYMGRVEVYQDRDRLALRFGAMQSIAGPSTQPDAVHVEFFPFNGMPILFDGSNARPDALLFRRQRFARV
jgi:CubicO group peptidase (beta-lactamase class C family)